MKTSGYFVLGFIVIFLIISMTSAVSAGVFDFYQPSKANPGDKVFEQIGGDDFLNATLKGCAKIGENYIPDASFSTSEGNFTYYDAKNISYVDENGNRGYMIVWKTLPFKNGFDTSWDVNQYVSCYLLDINAKAFLVYSWEDYYAYGIILCNDEINYSESDLLYDILGLDSQEYELVYTDTGNDTKTDTANETAIGTSYSTYYPASSGSSHYHTVVPDRYTLSRTDPGAYYDHYEYGDNYEIDDYLESEGYD